MSKAKSSKKSSSPTFTYEGAVTLFKQGQEEVVDVLLEMTARIKELEGMKAKNSKNSSKPPSSDGLSKPAPKGLRKKSKRKSGGQKGHKGSSLKRKKKPDIIEVHNVDHCENCGCNLEDEKVLREQSRQVFDIPPVQLVVTEHRTQVKRCSCGHITMSQFPDGVNAPVQYGSRIKAMSVYLNQYQLLPYARLCETMRDLFKAPLSEGTLANMIHQAGELSQKSVDQIRETLLESKVVHFDETGMRRKGKTNWMHYACTPKMSLFTLHKKRGKEAMDAAGVLPEFKGTAIHDYWKSYYQYDCAHALCNVHHLRDLIYIHEQLGQNWAKEAIETLLQIKKSVDTAKQEGKSLLSSKTVQNHEIKWDEILKKGYAENPDLPPPKKKKRGRVAKGKARNLIERFDHQRHEVLAFMYNFDIPFDNNLAENGIRMNKVKQKISGCFRSIEYSEDFCKIRSYICTARKNAIGAFNSIIQLFEGHSILDLISNSVAE